MVLDNFPVVELRKPKIYARFYMRATQNRNRFPQGETRDATAGREVRHREGKEVERSQYEELRWTLVQHPC
jgi:hypothetical protein